MKCAFGSEIYDVAGPLPTLAKEFSAIWPNGEEETIIKIRFSSIGQNVGTPIWAKTADDIHRVQEAMGQSAWQRSRARRYFKNNEIKSSIYLFTSDLESGFENFRELCEDIIDKREYKEIILAKQVELDDTETKMPTILAWVNPTLEWHTWVQCKTNISYSRGSSSGLARRDPIADVAALRAAAMAAVAELQK